MRTVSLQRSSQSSGSSKIYFSETRPVSSFDAADAPLEFAIPGSGNEYLDFKRSRLYLKVKITKSDGTAQAKNGGRQPTPTVLVFTDRRIHERKMCHSKRQQFPVEGLFKSPLVLLSNGQLLSTADAAVLSRLGQHGRR